MAPCSQRTDPGAATTTRRVSSRCPAPSTEPRARRLAKAPPEASCTALRLNTYESPPSPPPRLLLPAPHPSPLPTPTVHHGVLPSLTKAFIDKFFAMLHPPTPPPPALRTQTRHRSLQVITAPQRSRVLTVPHGSSDTTAPQRPRLPKVDIDHGLTGSAAAMSPRVIPPPSPAAADTAPRATSSSTAPLSAQPAAPAAGPAPRPADGPATSLGGQAGSPSSPSPASPPPPVPWFVPPGG